MLTKVPACRAVCKGKPGAVMDELVDLLIDQRRAGKAESDVLHLVRDPVALANLFPPGSLGRFPAVAESFVGSGCSECAVNKAYAAEIPGSAPRAPVSRHSGC